jgi:hypothetical protein
MVAQRMKEDLKYMSTVDGEEFVARNGVLLNLPPFVEVWDT